MELIKITIVNLTALIGMFIGFGLLFGFIENVNNKLIYSSFGRKGLVITGIIGTVIHETSHLLMALIFRHKIQEVKFFKPFSSKEDNVLGYVNHSYNKKSLYQNIGNFFIGIAPLIGGNLVILLLFKLLIPSGYETIKNSIDINLYSTILSDFNIFEFIRLLLNNFILFIENIFTNFSISTIIFIILMYSISTHMGLSKADLKGSLNGLVFIFIVVFLISLFKVNLFSQIIIVRYNVYLFIFMTLGFLFSIITLIISYVVNLLIKKVFR